jgi:hypothetical protein
LYGFDPLIGGIDRRHSGSALDLLAHVKHLITETVRFGLSRD